MESVNAERVTFKFTGDGLEMAILMLKNLFLTIVTLGIYRPWATTNMRRYVWGHTTFLDDRANYTGTGKELFRGWVKLFGLMFGLVMLVKILGLITPLLGVLVFPVYMLIFALAAYSGLRYRLSRTQWRQIRFGVEKNEKLTKEFLKMYLTGILLSAITLSIYTPWFKTNIRKFLTDRSRFGGVHFSYDGDGSEYAGIFFTGLALSIVTLGLYLPWWTRNLVEYRWRHTHFQSRSFGFSLSGKDLFIYFALTILATVLTAGLAAPWMYVWGLRLFAEHTYMDGLPDFALVQALPSDGSAMADDIVSGYDLDLGF